jgi:hypothetical protein
MLLQAGANTKGAKYYTKSWDNESYVVWVYLNRSTNKVFCFNWFLLDRSRIEKSS